MVPVEEEKGGWRYHSKGMISAGDEKRKYLVHSEFFRNLIPPMNYSYLEKSPSREQNVQNQFNLR